MFGKRTFFKFLKNILMVKIIKNRDQDHSSSENWISEFLLSYSWRWKKNYFRFWKFVNLWRGFAFLIEEKMAESKFHWNSFCFLCKKVEKKYIKSSVSSEFHGDLKSSNAMNCKHESTIFQTKLQKLFVRRSCVRSCERIAFFH